MNEAGFSETIKLTNDDGAERMVTFRGESASQWEAIEVEITRYLRAKAEHGWRLITPRQYVPQASMSGDDMQPIPVPKCRIHGSEMKPSKKPGGFFCPRKLADGTYCTEKHDPK